MIADRVIAVLLVAVGGGGAGQTVPPTPEQQAARLEAMADAAIVEGDRSEHRQPATRRVVAVACRLAPMFHASAFGRTGQSAADDRLAERIRALDWRSLPATARCGKATVTFQPKGFGAFVTDVARSGDGRFVGLRGGWQAAPLAGAGADCLYDMAADEPKLVGCVRTWVS